MKHPEPRSVYVSIQICEYCRDEYVECITSDGRWSKCGNKECAMRRMHELGRIVTKKKGLRV